ncbi:MAG: FAD-linked oxidase C-terminal domain-containing protein [Planctomycetota bacterium]
MQFTGTTAPPPVGDAVEQSLRTTIRGDVHTDDVRRGVYATDASLYQQVPAVVVVPADQDDAVAAIKFAHEHKMAITPRGGATSLSGQTFGKGMVLDVSKSLNKVLEVNAAEQWARVEPGVVRDELNAALKADRLHFAPDPATGNRATIGGMIGNNTCGTRSIVYGKTIDHVLEVKVALADGTVCDFAPCDDAEWDRRAAGQGVSASEAAIYAGVKRLITTHRDAILERFPKVMRRVSGYNLDEFVDGAGYTGAIGPRAEFNAGRRTWNLASLIVGSEGTLATILEAKIRLTPLPTATAVCVVHFTDLIESLRHVDGMLEFGPSTVELLDRDVISEARVNPATAHMTTFLTDDPEAVQIVEFFGDTPQDAENKAKAFADAMRDAGIGFAWPVFADAKGQSNIWSTRKLGLGLISNVKGSTKGRDFIEDACVPTDKLAQYVSDIRDLCATHGVRRVSIYAHASVGVCHIVPALDLHHEDEVAKMATIADQAFAWVMEYGGSWSGEHGDGQLRGRLLPKMFGDQVYGAFRELKQVFDPTGIMNPGKVIDAPAMDQDLRYQQPGYSKALTQLKPVYNHRNQGGFALAVEQCNGVGACRKTGSGTMCPSYMATRDEEASVRGRANALRLAMSGQYGPDPMDALASDGVHDVLSLCLSCKACKSECPNEVDMAKLKADAMQARHDRKGVTLNARAVGGLPAMAKMLAGPFAPIANAMNAAPGVPWLREKLTGFDRRRPIPGFASKSLHALLRQRNLPTGDSSAAPRGRVVLFNDTYANSMEPEVGLAAVELLEGCGFHVTLANAGCCQRTRISKGLLREAKRDGLGTLTKLAGYAKLGMPILCLEPSCASALVDDLPDLLDDDDIEIGNLVAANTFMIDRFLVDQGVELAPAEGVDEVLLHGHCHQKAMFGTDAIKKAYADMGDGNGTPGVDCEEVDSGCCGMAGSFGYEHHDLSEKIGEDRLFPAVREAKQQGKTVVACGISCRHQLHDFLHVSAKHWVQTVRPAGPATSGAADK